MQVCITHFPSEYSSWLRKWFLSQLFDRLSKASRYKRNPRDIQYMRALVTEFLGQDIHWVKAKYLRPNIVKEADKIILLWPDGNGYGWFWVEFRVFAWRRGSTVMVLNGRRRYFQLTLKLWLAYCLRRFLERFWIGEIVFSIIFLVVSPFLVAWDLLRGHK
jgi:hypothetical protein